jgi:Ca2+-transporting ATPase
MVATRTTLTVDVGRQGLTEKAAAVRLARHGPNRVAAAPPPATWRRILQQLRDPLILVLLAAMLLTLATGDWTDALIIIFVVVTNTAVGVSQERGADRAVAALSQIAAPEAHVWRDGRLRTAAAETLVPDDVVSLGEGDVVPADGTLAEAVRLLIDESALTGESQPVTKAVDVEGANELSAGTVVLRGRAVLQVTRTGADSALGRIAALVSTTPPRTPLQRRLAELGRTLAVAAAALSLVVFVVGVASGQGVELMAVTALSLVVAAVPESLPTVVTLALALGARQMARRHAIVRHLAAVETLGSVTIVATDKTGTLTRGDMVATAAWTPEGSYLLPWEDGEPPEPLSRLLRAAALCNDAVESADEEVRSRGQAVGDPTELALLRAATSVGWTRGRVDTDLPRVAEIPFDSTRRQMTTVHQETSGSLLVVSKGAPETLLSGSASACDATLRQSALDEANRLAALGQRVLVLAWGRAERLPNAIEALEDGLQLLGLIAVADPVRPSAAGTIRSFVTAGISPILISGDNLATASAVAVDAGFPDVPGKDQVFARATPEDKLSIVRSLQASGDVVAMIGDGVNDAPALRQADIGIAMGRRGTEAARQTADLILADDELATLTAAVEEGRRAYDNVRRFLLFGLAGGTAEIAVMLIAPLIGLSTAALLPGQILWINLLTHGLPGVAMGAEPAEPNTLRRPPRPPSQRVLGDGLWLRIGLIALCVTVASLVAGGWAHAAGRHWQTLVFTTLAVSQLAVAAAARSAGDRGRHFFLPVAIAVALMLQVAAVYLLPLQDLFQTSALPLGELGVVLGLAALVYAATRAATRPLRTVHEGVRARHRLGLTRRNQP